ncbi:hypothetical protein [Sinomonas sp. ASV322]|uniref:hypothetical protein n=1 Tax=Sinomonas sp. ASV322 TaxID=3041920 RepID=UPI0027DB4DA4|nr:hypothetical protein [Sinomonas sp. ASV322]MDQ4504409.1 hypothetical protein [Sinomonas sp. ASV322]
MRDVAAVLRPFFIAGWCASDVLHALDWRPDGTRWPHDGAPTWADTSRVRGWLRYRLAGWTRDGEPVRSPEQRRQAARTAQAIERRRVLEKQAEHAARLDQGDSPEKVRALATIRAMFAESRRKKTAKQTPEVSAVRVWTPLHQPALEVRQSSGYEAPLVNRKCS